MLQAFIANPDIQKLEGVFDGNRVLALLVLVVHQELHEVVEGARLEARLVEDASLVHQLELILINVVIQVLIHLLTTISYTPKATMRYIRTQIMLFISDLLIWTPSMLSTRLTSSALKYFSLAPAKSLKTRFKLSSSTL